MMDLGRLEAGGDVAAAMEAVLSAWREAPHPSWTRLLEQLEGKAPSSSTPRAATAKDRALEALERVKRVTGRDRATLAELAELLLGPPATALAVANGLAELEGDPRFETPLLEALTRAGRMSVDWYRGVGRALRQHGSVLAVDALQRTAEQLDGDRLASIDSTRKALVTRTPAELEPEFFERAKELIDRATWKLPRPPKTAAELLQPIYEQPGEQQLRQVAADGLSELGLPLGEFMTLQLQRPDGSEPSPRELELQAAHASTWLEPIWPLLDPDAPLTFSGGVLISATIRGGVSATRKEAMLERPEWSTLERVSLLEGAELSERAMRVHTIDRATALHIEALAKRRVLPPLVRMTVLDRGAPDRLASALERLRGRLKLERLVLVTEGTPDDVRPVLMASDLADHFHVEPVNFHTWRTQAAMRDLVESTSGNRISVTYWDALTLRLTREDGKFTEARMRTDRPATTYELSRWRYLMEMISGQPLKQLRLVSRSFKETREQLVALAEKNLPGVEVSFKRVE
ncbi:MAG: hypothetical protein QM817_27870 [Archangium sp.]